MYQGPQSVTLLSLCQHVIHAHCAVGGEGLSSQFDNSFVGLSGFRVNDGCSVSTNIALYGISMLPDSTCTELPSSAAIVQAQIQGCPVCHQAQQGEGSGIPVTLSQLQLHHSHPRALPPVISH